MAHESGKLSMERQGTLQPVAVPRCATKNKLNKAFHGSGRERERGC